MTNRLEDVLQSQEDNYILPFMWQRGEDEAIIREEMARIHESGIKAVCVEARPHPDFLGPQWWWDIDIIMEEARRRDMRVWMLDDDHFPTGHAAGKNANASGPLRRLFLKEHHIDAIGPQRDASFLIDPWFLDFRRPTASEGTLIAAIAARRRLGSHALTGEFIDLTANVRDNVLYWDVPEGYWRIFLLIVSPTAGSERHKDYINPLVAESVRVLIDAVYEAFYARYKDDFGHTFAGFFSDEPGFYNDTQVFDYRSKLGKVGVALPWRADMLEQLNAAFGDGYQVYLPLLWHDGGELTSAVRYTYMDVVSKLYAEHFTQQIGDWCRAHHVEYIGHVLEDNGVHTRLGCGAGHYFRALWGQDMAGLDVVLWQLVPGFDEGPFAGVSGEMDGEFFHYGLAKMGSSLAHIDPKKKGRAMCELFGAYGWREGLKLMKWMTDHLLVRGINYFVPHAFSQAEFPDRDCPPHMYARGMNPQYRYYRTLNEYTNRISHLLSGGRHVAPIAVLYHAEAEWSAREPWAGWMPFHKPVRILMQHQIDCDVLPGDALFDGASVSEDRLSVGDESYGCLVVPYAENLPSRLLARLVDLADQGVPVLFIERLPTSTCGGHNAGDVLDRLRDHPRVGDVPLDELVDRVREKGFCEVEVEDNLPYLHYYHAQYPDLDTYMFVNEHPYHRLETTLHIPAQGRVLQYDAFANQIYEAKSVKRKGHTCLSLQLEPFESTIVLVGEGVRHIAADSLTDAYRDHTNEWTIERPWTVSTATSQQYPSFEAPRDMDKLVDMSGPGLLPRFSGTFRYETSVEWADSNREVTIDLGQVYETAQVWINGQSAGIRICPPYRLEIGNLLHSDENTLVVEVTNTLAKDQHDYLSRFAQQEPSGLLGPVRLLY